MRLKNARRKVTSTKNLNFGSKKSAALFLFFFHRLTSHIIIFCCPTAATFVRIIIGTYPHVHKQHKRTHTHTGERLHEGLENAPLQSFARLMWLKYSGVFIATLPPAACCFTSFFLYTLLFVQVACQLERIITTDFTVNFRHLCASAWTLLVIFCRYC